MFRKGEVYQIRTANCCAIHKLPGRGTTGPVHGRWRRPRPGGGVRDACNVQYNSLNYF